MAMAAELARRVRAVETELLWLPVGAAAAAAARVNGGVVLEAEDAVDGGGVRGEVTGEAIHAHAANRAIEGVDEPRLRL